LFSLGLKRKVMKWRSILSAILTGGIIGGTLDLLFAFSFAGYNGAAPTRVLQTIASGLLGDAAFSRGNSAAALGFICHFGLSFIWAALFAGAAVRFTGLVRRPVLAGIAFGIVVFFCMRLVVLPLSAYPRPVTFRPMATTLDLLSHMLLFGTPIAIAVSRAMRARGPKNSFKPNPLRGST
jgi:uncharacterized membrane protein YagU involved in acid resistance